MKLGLQLGYWGQAPTRSTSRWRRKRSGSATTPCGPPRRGAPTRSRRDLDRRAHRDDQARHRRRADVGAHAGVVRDARDHARPPVERPLDPRARRVGPAGRRGLVRAAVRQAAGAHARVHRRHPPGAAPRGAGREPTARTTRCRTAATARWGSASRSSSIVHPLRADLPIYLGAEGPKNVALAAEIADGWLPLYYSPFRPEVYADSLGDREARLRDRGHGRRRSTSTDDIAEGRCCRSRRRSASTSAAWARSSATSTRN